MELLLEFLFLIFYFWSFIVSVSKSNRFLSSNFATYNLTKFIDDSSFLVALESSM